MRARILTVLCAAVAVVLATTATPASAQSFPTQTSWDFHRVNQVRAARATHALSDWSTLNWYAQVWADWMALHGTLKHGLIPTNLAGWRTLGQNVGAATVGPAAVEYAFEHDAPHLANILGRSYTRIGVGVAYGHGLWWVVQDYWG